MKRVLLAALFLASCSKHPVGPGADLSAGKAQYGQLSATDRQDLLALAHLTRGSRDPSKPTEFEHYLYVPTREIAALAVEELKKAGFKAAAHEPLGNLGNGEVEDRWSVLAKDREVPNLENLRKDRALFEALARRFDGEYDGWDAAGLP